MLTLAGLAVVTASVLVGFALAGGPFLVLLQPIEYFIIVGTAAGILLISASPAVLRQLVRQTSAALRPSPFSRDLYLDVLQMLYEVFVKAKRSGLIALEKDLVAPAESPIFSAHPRFLAHPDAVRLTCEALAVLVDGSVRPEDFEAILDVHLDTHHEEEIKASALLHKIADSLPGLGIVVAVLGIIITMQHVGGRPEEIGHYVAVALVGTFLGVLLSYGYVQPLAIKLEAQAAASGRFLRCIKDALLAFARGAPPIVAVEIARHTIFSEARPEAEELAAACRAAADRLAERAS
jgi:chemotaxis protein MotA